MYKELTASANNATAYYAGLKEKGQGDGTSVGNEFNKGAAYIDVFIGSVNVFNYCDLDYYLRSFSTVFSSSGAVNLGVNLMWRIFSTDDMDNYEQMSIAVSEKDQVKAGQSFGTFISLLLMFETPE